jgi:Chaperone of endosialidase
MKTKNMTTLHLRKSINRSPLRLAFLLIPFALAWFALSPQARAVCQEGCLTNENTALGDNALLNDTTGFQNTATGDGALFSNTEGTGSAATGAFALENNTTGNFNTATGSGALQNNTTGDENTATGAGALLSNTTGNFNTATGSGALQGNTTGDDNTAIGVSALLQNREGSNNIALGSGAGLNLETGNKNIYIGNAGLSSNENGKIRIGTTGIHGRTFIAGISGVTVPAGVGVIVGTDGKLGTVVSSERFKAETKPMDKASEVILALKPVTFRYKKEFDPAGIPQFGLVAEQVEKVNPDLVARDDHGKPYTVRYEAVNAMLLNEFLKEHRKGQEQDATISQLKTELAQQHKEIKALSAQIQKVSAQVELSKPAPQTVVDNH